MSKKTFYAAKLVDSAYKTQVLCHRMSLDNREAIVKAAEEIKKDGHTPEQISGILGVVLARADTLLTDEDKSGVFQGITPAETLDPFEIELGPENYAMLYTAFSECATESSEGQADPSEIPSDVLVAELEMLQCYDEAVVPYQNLPLADESLSWDAGAARKALKKWATKGEGEVDWKKYRRGFLWYDSADPDKAGAYKYPIATIIEGRLKAVPAGIFAAASMLNKGKISSADKASIRAQLTKYYKKMDKDPPWKGESEKDPEELAAEIEKLSSEAEELKKAAKPNEDLQEKLTALEELVAKLSTEAHVLLAHEAAHLAQKVDYPAAHGKDFDKLCEVFAERTEESLKDLIGDLINSEKSETGKHVDITGPIETVTDPTAETDEESPVSIEHGAPPPGETPLQTQMVNDLTEVNEDTVLLFNLTGKNKEELKARIERITGPDKS